MTRSNYVENKSLTFDKVLVSVTQSKTKKLEFYFGYWPSFVQTICATQIFATILSIKLFVKLFYHCDDLNLENDFSIRIIFFLARSLSLSLFVSLSAFTTKNNVWHVLLIYLFAFDTGFWYTELWTDTLSVLHEYFLFA